MVSRSERPLAAHGNGACHPAQRAFGCDMQAIGAEGIDAARHFGRRRDREPDVGIGRAGDGRKALRREQLDGMPQLGQFATRHLQRAHHAIDLRIPCFGDDKNLHAGFFA